MRRSSARDGRLHQTLRIAILLVAVLLIAVPIYSLFAQQNHSDGVVIASSAAQSDASQPQTKTVVVIQLYEEIDQGSAAMVSRGISQAESVGAQAIVIDMNTPGGELSDMLTMIYAIGNSSIPVYTFVGNGSSAASAGSYVAMATDKIYMSPYGSVIGPSTPYVVGGTTAEQDHVANYTLVKMVGLAQQHGRNVTAVTQMAGDNVAFTGAEAVRFHVADNYSTSLAQTLGYINASGAKIDTVSENLSEQTLTFLSNPTVDGILLIVGIVAIAIDFFHPTVLLTIAGVVLIILALIGEEAIEGPAGYPGIIVPIVLFIAAGTLIILEIKTGHGIMLLAGVIVGAFATLLFAYQVPYSPSPIGDLQYFEITILVIIGGILALYARYMGSTIRKKPVTGQESLIGAKGIVYSEQLVSEGEVNVNGIVWRAHLANPGAGSLKKGDGITVTKVEGLTLFVDRNA